MVIRFIFFDWSQIRVFYRDDHRPFPDRSDFQLERSDRRGKQTVRDERQRAHSFMGLGLIAAQMPIWAAGCRLGRQ